MVNHRLIEFAEFQGIIVRANSNYNQRPRVAQSQRYRILFIYLRSTRQKLFEILLTTTTVTAWLVLDNQNNHKNNNKKD